MRKARPWKEAPFFHLIGLLIAGLGLLVEVIYYLERLSHDGWLNDHFAGVTLYAFLFFYFIIGARYGEGEADAVEEVLEKKEKK